MTRGSMLVVLQLVSGARAANMFGCEGVCTTDNKVTKCVTDWPDDCDKQHYSDEPLVVLCGVVAGLCLLLLLVWCCGGCACICRSYCCGTGPRAGKIMVTSGGGKGVKWCLVVLTLVVGVISVGLGVSAVGDVKDSRDDLFDAADRETRELFEPRIAHEKERLQVNGMYIVNPSTGETTAFIVDDTQQAYDDVTDQISSTRSDVEDFPVWVLYFLVLPVWVLVVCALFCAACTEGMTGGVFGLVLLLLAAISWVLQMGLSVLPLVAEDGCSELLRMNSTEDGKPGLLRDLVDGECPDLGDTETRVRVQGDGTAGTVCGYLSDYCAVTNTGVWDPAAPERVLECPEEATTLCNSAGSFVWPWLDLPATPRTIPTAAEIFGYTVLLGTPGGCNGCTVEECTTDCTGGTRTTAVRVFTNLDYGDRLADVLVTDVLYLLDCNTARGAISEVSPECDDLEEALQLLTSSTGLVSVMVTLLALALIVGSCGACCGCCAGAAKSDEDAAPPVHPSEPLEDDKTTSQKEDAV